MISRIYRLFRRQRKPKTLVLRPQGNHYNLQEIYEDLNHKYFGAKLDLRVSWFGNGVTIPKTRMLFGSYNHQNKLVKVNRLLDKEAVPEYFVRYIIYHEMVHDAFPPVQGKNGRRRIHHKAFKEKEKEFEDYASAQDFLKEWIKKNTAYSSEKR